jgi:hypothetical protein
MRHVSLDPIRECINMSSNFSSEFGQGVFDHWGDGRVYRPNNEAVGFQRLKRLSQHLFAYSIDTPGQFAEAVCTFAKNNKD